MERFERGEFPETGEERRAYRYWRNLGKHTDTWAAFIPNRAEYVDKIYEHMKYQMLDRGWNDLSIYRTGIILELANKHNLDAESRFDVHEHLLFERNVDNQAILAIGLQVTQKAEKDLEITWRFYQKQANFNFFNISTGWNIFWAILIILVGVPLILAGGVGCLVIPFGFYILGLSLKLYQHSGGIPGEYTLESKSYIEAFDYCLMAALEEVGIYKGELRILEDTVKGGVAEIDNK